MKKLKDQVKWSEVFQQTGAPGDTIGKVRMGLIDGFTIAEIAQRHNLDLAMVEAIAEFFLEDVVEDESADSKDAERNPSSQLRVKGF